MTDLRCCDVLDSPATIFACLVALVHLCFWLCCSHRVLFGFIVVLYSRRVSALVLTGCCLFVVFMFWFYCCAVFDSELLEFSYAVRVARACFCAASLRRNWQLSDLRNACASVLACDIASSRWVVNRSATSLYFNRSVSV